MIRSDTSNQPAVMFENPFHIEDLQVFDDEALHSLLAGDKPGITAERLALALRGAAEPLVKRITTILPPEQQKIFTRELYYPAASQQVAQARQQILNDLFWEFIYWKTPELYEELTEGERLHPGIFQHLAADLYDKTVLDAGAGSGRASLECLHCGAKLVYALEPSLGLRRILKRKLAIYTKQQRIALRAGRFEQMPFTTNSIDVALSCSAFTAAPEQGGEAGLAELKRVTRPGGKIFIIWPRPEDHAWLQERGFQYVSLPTHGEMYVYFRSLQTALHCAHLFYGHNQRVMNYTLTMQRPEIPFSVIGMNPPCDYYWLTNR